jgi:hypothetical protein
MKQHRVLFLLLFLHGLCRKGDDVMTFHFIVITLCAILLLIYSFVLEIKIEKRNKANKRKAHALDKFRKNFNIDVQ